MKAYAILLCGGSGTRMGVRDNKTLQSIALGGLYPCGEGAGYAGGIISAAVDGIKCAEAVINSNNN